MFDECILRGRKFTPARFCAPLAGYTHSAFRRLLAELGGCGLVWTEMLAARQILSEDFCTSPWLRRRPGEEALMFQLMVRASDPLERIFKCMADNGVEMVDLNLACDARAIRNCEAGSALFENFESLRATIPGARRCWPGLLLAKIRLGSQRPGWEARFTERVKFLEDAGVDALTLHSRFFEEKFKRRAHHDLLAWAASQTRLPLIACGDISGPDSVRAQADLLKPAVAIMIGRMAVARPWIFATWETGGTVDAGEIWRKMHQYISEDFPPVIALRRLQMFSRYYSANFQFGHQFHVDISNATSMENALESANRFFDRNPAVLSQASTAVF
jgi:tRNA-dihydrouridine synthase